jgi:two-component system CheB/CheR fusion protein
MGIGLALVKQLIELHGGTVAAASAPGRGARFTIELPITSEEELPAGSLGQSEAGVLAHLRILIVDDSADTVDMLRQLFEMDGAVVATARGASEALEIARHKDFDVVLSDISMPGMDGFEFLCRLRELTRHKDVPVLAITGFGGVDDVRRAEAEGFYSHITKPIDVNNVVEILRSLPNRNLQAASTRS